MKLTYKHTIAACFTGYIVQAIINNFAPLLFLTFQTEYGIALEKITLLITFNFVVQLCVDLASAAFVDRLGYRSSMILAHVLGALGLLSMAFLPALFPDPFWGLLVAVLMYAIGGGLLEVLVSPVVEACPTDNKEKWMGLLHSFYCWGQVGVVLLSTLFFALFGISNWRILAVIWALVPAVNALIFTKVPITALNADGEGLSLASLLKNRLFWVLCVMMLCAGASEMAVSQWASTLAEKGLGVTKTVGDLAGPMLFAALMGTARALYGKFADRVNTERLMFASALLCVFSYLCISLVPSPAISFLGCGICGFSVGIMWPGTFSRATAALPKGGTMMFALLALCGDLGCSGGPTFAGFVASAAGENLKAGVLAAVVFPASMAAMLLLSRKKPRGE